MKRFALALAAGLMMVGAATAPAQWRVCIDPGHGGTDPGAVGNGLQEKTVCLDMSNRFKTWMDLDTQDTSGGTSFTVFRTRTGDSTVSLSGRTNYANNNNVHRFMSIHANAFSSSSANGIETFCWGSGSSNSFDLRNKVYQEATAMWPLTKRGTKTANFYVVRYTNMPAELHETAFITNANDASYLGNATQRNNFARSQLYAIQRHVGVAKYTPGSSAWSAIVDNTSSGATPGSGWWTATAVGGYYGSNYHTRGTAAVSDPFTWTRSLPSSGTYRVDAWWTQGANRSASAPYIITRSGGTSTVNVNQQINGGKWNTLGQWSFPAGTATVRLSCWTTTGFFVVADAIRFTRL